MSVDILIGKKRRRCKTISATTNLSPFLCQGSLGYKYYLFGLLPSLHLMAVAVLRDTTVSWSPKSSDVLCSWLAGWALEYPTRSRRV